MKHPRCVFALTVAVVSSACSSEVRPRPVRVPAGGVPTSLRIQLSPKGPIRRVPLEDYVQAAILSEFAPAAGDPASIERMLEVQAVIARTYAIASRSRHHAEGFDLCSTTHCQIYEPSRLKTSSWAPQAEEAIKATSGMVLWYETSAARALFHADCGGHLSAVADVWTGMPRAYLKAAPDDGIPSSVHTTWRYDVERRALLTALNRDSRTRVGKELREIIVTQRDEAGRAALVMLRGSRDGIVKGEELRTVLTTAFGPKTVRSTRFEVQRTGNRFVFSGRGFGHGVGLCQAGAYARLRAGATPEQVLARYYPGTRLVVVH
jgi:stage II sporulation protein D